ELGEIESALRSHPAVRNAAVIVSGEQQKLIAYLSAAGGEVPDSGNLRRFLRAKLPDYMLPSSYIVQEKLPALPSGKVDRRALQAMAAAQKGGGEAARYVAPQTEVEQSLADIYRDVLKVERVGREDHFFNLGGHSLLAVQVVSRIRRVLDVEISVRRIFEQPEVAALALVVEEAIRAGDKPRRPVLTRSSSNEDRELLMAHLNSLSPDQIRHLLDQLVSRRNPAS
ncbi:MAG: hypothetical protein JOZ22_16045, partial [Acidobacteriia bacterium]|nr:hypothetical protein [Terriglobia bacterium]